MRKILMSAVALSSLFLINDASATWYVGGGFGKSMSPEQTVKITERLTYANNGLGADFTGVDPADGLIFGCDTTGDGSADTPGCLPIFAGDVTTLNISYSDGGIYSIFAGYRIPNTMFRLEGEIFKMDSGTEDSPAILDIDRVDPANSDISGAVANYTGWYEMGATAFMLNAYVDFDLWNSNFVPYIGLGIGMADISLDSKNLYGDVTGLSPYYAAKSTGYEFSWQFLLGVDARLFDDRNWVLGLQYRMFTQDSALINDEAYDSSFNALMFRVAYEFGGAPTYQQPVAQQPVYVQPAAPVVQPATPVYVQQPACQQSATYSYNDCGERVKQSYNRVEASGYNYYK